MKHDNHRMHANSKAAYASSDFGERERAIIRVVSESSVPLSDREIAQRLGYTDLNAVRPRITTLINDEHVLAEGPTVKCKTTGRPVRTVVLVVAVQQVLA